MKKLKYGLSLLLISSLFIALPSSFAVNKSLSLDDAITLSKENSAQIRSIENQEFSTKESIRKNIQQSYQVASSLEQLYDYIEILDAAQSVGHPFHKYLGDSDDSLIRQIGTSDPFAPTDPSKATGLVKDLMTATSTASAEAIQDEMAFIQLYIYYGDDVGLTKESKYNTFKKNEAMLVNSIELIETKYNEGLQAAIKGTEAGAIQLYIGLYDLGEGVRLQEQMLQTYEDGLENMTNSYNQGLVSKIAYEEQKMTTEQKRLEVQNLALQYKNLDYQLKKMCGLPMSTNVTLSTKFNNGDYKLDNPGTYYDEALASNMDHIVLLSEQTYNEKNFDVMNQYLDDVDKDTGRTIYYQEKEDMKDTLADLGGQLYDKEQSIKSNVNDAYNDLIYQGKLVEHNNTAVRLAASQLNNGIQLFKLGQITELELDQLRLGYENAEFTAEKNVRSYNTSVERFKLLVDYGVTYSTN